MEKKSELLIRLYVVVGAFALVAVVIFWRVIKVNVLEGDKWRKKGDKHLKWMPIEADRGDRVSIEVVQLLIDILKGENLLGS